MVGAVSSPTEFTLLVPHNFCCEKSEAAMAEKSQETQLQTDDKNYFSCF